jgi:hypothetical protein
MSKEKPPGVGLASQDKKIMIGLGGLRFSFASASELRDALLASFADADFAGGPLIVINTIAGDLRPAWSWVIDLLRRRTDWWLALGVALQHATLAGGEIARVALADLMANFTDSVALLEWTAPLAERWPEVRATSSGTGWGGPNLRLADILSAQRSYAVLLAAEERQVILDGFGPRGPRRIGVFRDERGLEELLAKTARSGRFYGTRGPWSWLSDELLLRPWIRGAMPRIAAAFADGPEPGRYALLDWLGEECDLWRFTDLLEGWRATPPPWWPEPARKKPPGWRHRIRPSFWREVQSVGDVALRLLALAHEQRTTPPVLDLSLLLMSRKGTT